MKRILFLIITLLMLLPCMAQAADPIITSDVRTFNPLKGEYTLKGNVFVQLTPHDQVLTITGDYTTVMVFSMEVHGQGNIGLSYGDLKFKCDKTDVYHSKRTAFVEGNLTFQDGNTIITAEKGAFCWKTKLATFQGKVMVNGKPYEQEIQYNVQTKEITGTPGAPLPQAPIEKDNKENTVSK